MNPVIHYAAIWTALTTLLLSALAWTEANGFVSERVTNLWAKAIVLIEGPSGYRATDAFYPPFPYALTLITQGLTGGTSVPIPLLLSAGFGAVLLIIWYRNLRDKGGFGALASGVAVFLLAANPFFVRALAEGPEAILLLTGTWIYTRGIVNLRLSGNAPDMMKVAVGLLIVSLSHSYGLLICAGAMPCIIIAARPSMLAASPWGYLVSMFFPVAMAAASLLFISAIFNSSLIPLISSAALPTSLDSHLVVLSGIVPVVVIAVFRTIKSSRHFMPLLAAMGTILGAYILNINYRIEADPIIAIAPMLSVIPVAMRFWPPVPLRTTNMIALLSVSFMTCLTFIGSIKNEGTAAWYRAVTMRGDDVPLPTQAVGAFLGDKNDIMVDVERNPQIVTALGTVDNLILAGTPTYEIALRGGRITASYIVTQNVDGDANTKDRVLLGFPRLNVDMQPNYRIVFEDAGWRVFQRQVQ
jgi:hypothetical protein